MLTENVFIFGHSIPLDLSITMAGVVWTGLALCLFLSEKGRRFISTPPAAGIFFVLLVIALSRVLAEIAEIQELAGGLKIPDTRLNYNAADIQAFASALGDSGRGKYAAFQYGSDTLAPPAFACFVSSMAFNLLSREKALNCLSLVFVYLFCAVMANGLMPVIMLSFPDSPPFLLSLVPWLDFFKYLVHFTAWCFITVNLPVLKKGFGRLIKIKN